MLFLDLLKHGLVRTNSSGAFPVTEEDIINFQREQDQARIDQRFRSDHSLRSSSDSQEDSIVIVRGAEGIERKMEIQTSDYERLDEGPGTGTGCSFDMSALPGGIGRRTPSSKSAGSSVDEITDPSKDFLDAIEFMGDNTSHGDNVLLLRHQVKSRSVRGKARQVVTKPFRSGLRLLKSIGERLRVFQRNHLAETKLWARKRRYLDRTASINDSDGEYLEFERSSSIGEIEGDTLEFSDS